MQEDARMSTHMLADMWAHVWLTAFTCGHGIGTSICIQVVLVYTHTNPYIWAHRHMQERKHSAHIKVYIHGKIPPHTHNK